MTLADRVRSASLASFASCPRRSSRRLLRPWRPLPEGAFPARLDVRRRRGAWRVGGGVLRNAEYARLRIRGLAWVRGHSHPAGAPGLAAVARAHSRGTHRVERGDVDRREPRHPYRTAARRSSRIGGGCRSGVRRRRGAFRGCSVLVARRNGRGPGQPDVARRRSVRGALAAGFGAIVRSPRIRLVVSLIFAQAFVRGCLNVLIVVAAFQVLDAGGQAVGYMTAALGVGGLSGRVGAMTLGGQRLAVPFGVSLVFWGLPIALMGPLAGPPVRSSHARSRRCGE